MTGWDRAKRRTRAAPCRARGEPQRVQTKFLVDRQGVPVRRYSPADPLDQGMEADVVALLEGRPLKAKPRTYLGAA